MDNIFLNLDQILIGLFFISDSFFYVELIRKKDLWTVEKFDKIQNISELPKNSSICICLDPDELQHVTLKLPDMPEDDIKKVIHNEINPQNEFYLVYRKITSDYEIFFTDKTKIDELLKKLPDMYIRAVTLFEAEKYFPIDMEFIHLQLGKNLDKHALFAACSLAFPEITTLNFLPTDKIQLPPRYNYKNLTILLWFVAVISFAWIFLTESNQLQAVQKNLQIVTKELESTPKKSELESVIKYRESLAEELIRKYSDNEVDEIFEQVSQIKIDNVYLKSFVRTDNELNIKIVGQDEDSLLKFFSQINSSQNFSEKIYFDKSGNWFLDINVNLRK